MSTAGALSSFTGQLSMPVRGQAAADGIAGIDFQLDRLGTPAQIENWLAAWWQGDGLIGRCPGCGQYVQYGYFVKRAMQAVGGNFLLPDDWFQKSVVGPRAVE